MAALVPSAATAARALASAMAVLLAACGREEAEQPKAEPPPVAFERASGNALEHGERMARVLGCRGCHGDDLTGHAWIEDPQVAILYTSNLTRSVPEYSDAELARTIREGARPDGSPLWAMPSEIFTELHDADMVPLIAWLRTVRPAGTAHPRIAIGPQGRREIASGEIVPAPEEVRRGRGVGPSPLDGRHEFARYMIRATCSECHGLDLTGSREEGRDGRRGPPDLIVASGYTREQFRRLMRTGLPPDGRDLGLMKRVSESRFAHLTTREIDSIYDYLAARAAAPQ